MSRVNSWGALKGDQAVDLAGRTNPQAGFAQIADAFPQTVNALKCKVTMLFIAHQLPRGLQVDEVVQFGAQPRRAAQPAKHMSVIDEEKAKQ